MLLNLLLLFAVVIGGTLAIPVMVVVLQGLTKGFFPRRRHEKFSSSNQLQIDLLRARGHTKRLADIEGRRLVASQESVERLRVQAADASDLASNPARVGEFREIAPALFPALLLSDVTRSFKIELLEAWLAPQDTQAARALEAKLRSPETREDTLRSCIAFFSAQAVPRLQDDARLQALAVAELPLSRR